MTNKYKRKILITGCAGFIGSNLVEKLLSKNNKIIGIDNLSTGQKKFLNNSISNKNFKFIKMDLLNLKPLKKILKNIDIVYHLAANADVRFGLNHPKKDLIEDAMLNCPVHHSLHPEIEKHIVFTWQHD